MVLLHELHAAEEDALNCFSGFRVVRERGLAIPLFDFVMLWIGAAALRDGFVDVGRHSCCWCDECY